MSQRKFLTRFSEGQYYMDHWPMRKELNPIFPEMRVIKATRFGYKTMPAVAAITVLMQMVFHNYDALPEAVITALFAISLPLQGFWWLGTRSKTRLPPSLINWYEEIHKKILDTGCVLEPVKKDLHYLELAKLLSRAFKELDEHALKRWF